MPGMLYARWSLALLVFAMLSPVAMAADGWREGAPMTTGRAFAGGALLGDEFYVVGGDSTAGPRTVAEIYDIRGDIWRASPDLPVGLQQFGMAELDGKIYVSGGYEGPPAQRPAFGVFGDTMPAPRSKDSGGDTAHMWIYDPAIGTWLAGANMPGVRAGHGFLAVDGNIYAIGGRGDAVSRVWAYDPHRNQWRATGDAMPAPRVAAAYAAVNGQIYVIGGLSNGATTSRVDIFDPASGHWRGGPSLPKPRAGHVVAVMDGMLHVTGGEDHRPPRTYGDHFILDVARGASAGTWSRAAPMPSPRHGAVAAAANGKFVVVGGSPGAGVYTVFTESDVVDIYSAK